MEPSFLQHLPDPLNRLDASACRKRSVCAGDTLFKQGDITRGLFFLLDGAIHLRRVTKAGHDVVVHRAKAGETFAEASLFQPSYHCDAVAVEPSNVIECSKKAIISQYHQFPEFAFALSKRFAAQVQHTRSRLELLSIRSADERVLQALVDGLLSGSVKSFASEIALSPEAVYRSLASLSKAGRIRKLGYGQYAPLASDPA